MFLKFIILFYRNLAIITNIFPPFHLHSNYILILKNISVHEIEIFDRKEGSRKRKWARESRKHRANILNLMEDFQTVYIFIYISYFFLNLIFFLSPDSNYISFKIVRTAQFIFNNIFNPSRLWPFGDQNVGVIYTYYYFIIFW